MSKSIHYILLGMLFIFTFNQCDNVNTDVPEEEEEVVVELMTPTNNASQQSLKVELKWKKIKGAKLYVVQLATNDEFSTTVVDSTVEETSLTTPDLEPNEQYHWRVLPTERGPNTKWSDAWSFTTGESDTPIITTNLISPEDRAVVQNPNISFEWQNISEAENYHFQVSSDTSFNENFVDSLVSSSSITLEELPSGSTYVWRVTPILNEGTGGVSENRTFEVEESTPPEIDVTLSSPTDEALDVSVNPSFNWSGNGEIEEFNLLVSEQSDLSNPVIDETTISNSYNAMNLEYDTEYFWQVTAYSSEDTEYFVESSVRSFTTESNTTEPPVNNTDFVQVENGNFVLDGQPFRYAGTNAYYLPNYEKINSGVVDRAMELFEDTGVNVVRMWAFYDGYDCGYSQNDPSENVIQTAPGEYSEEALRDLDRVIAQGKEHGIRFIMPFVNYWDELGGICQYNT